MNDHSFFQTVHSEGALGEWWLPKSPKEKFPGVLRFRGTDIFLEIIGDLSPEMFKSSWHCSAIWGLTSSGQKITLLNCSVHTASFPQWRDGTTTHSWEINVHFLVNGAYFKSMDNKVITDFEIGVNHLDVWSYQFNERYKFSEKSGRLSVARKNPKSFKVEIDNNELNLFCYFQDTAARSTVKHKVFFATFWVSCGTPMSLNEARNFAYKLLSFMRFTLRKYVMFDSLRVKAVSYNTQQDLSLSSTHFGLIQPIISDVEFDRFSIIFNINHIMKRFPQIMRLWLSMDSIMEHVIESLIESLYRKDQYFAISNFINLVSALDSFSSDRYGDKAKMEDRLNSVTKNLPQQWLNILDEKNTLVSDILKYRHGYVHYKKGRLRGSFNETYQIIDLNWQVERLLICLILRFLGFNDKEIVHYLEYGRISDTFL